MSNGYGGVYYSKKKTLIGIENKDLLLDEREIYTARIVTSENGTTHIEAPHKTAKAEHNLLRNR